MKVRLGIVAPMRARATIEQAAATLPGVEPEWLFYDSEESIPTIVEQALSRCDALCFSGDLPYDKVAGMLPEDLPVSVVRLTSFDVALCLLRAHHTAGGKLPFSMDTADPRIVRELVRELNLDDEQISYLPYGHDVSIDDVVAFHMDAHARHGTAFVITGRSNAVEKLMNQLPVPVFAAVPVISSIRSAMNRGALGATSRRHADNRFAMAIFRIAAPADLIEAEVRRLSLARALHRSLDLGDAWVEDRGGGQDVLVFGDKRLMQKLTSDWTAIPIVAELQHQLGFPVAVGFGLGNSARRSVQFAETAVTRAVRDGGSCGYLQSEDGVVIGPMTGDTESVQRYRFRSEDVDIASLARRTGLGVPTVSRLLDFEDELRGQPISATDVARKLRLSAPSGRRIVRKLADHGLVNLAGSEQASGRGRPTNLFKLALARKIKSGTDKEQPADDLAPDDTAAGG